MAAALKHRGFPSGGRRPRPVRAPGVVRLVAAIAVVGVGLLPVQYRGGAERPHAHSALQLWLDAAHGTTDHHAFDPLHGHAGEDEPAAEPAPRPAAEPAPPDTPRWTTVSPAVERAAVVVVLVALGVGLLLARATPWPGLARPLAGLTPTPEPPPPRAAAAAF